MIHVNNIVYTVSIAMCTYNGGEFLREQLESILHQTWQPDEIIICDDQSTDNSVLIAKSVLEKWNGKWQIIVNEKNLGFKKNFQKAISLCQGDIIFLSDQDDVWDKSKIEIMMQAFEDENVILAFHDAELVDENLKQLYPSFWKTMNFDPELFQKNDFRSVFAQNIMQGAACCFRKALFYKATPFPMNVIHDEWLLLVGLCEGKVFPVNKALLKYRQARNVIGGKPLTWIGKVYKWVGCIHNAVVSHITYLKSREYTFRYLTKKYASVNLASDFYDAACDFYEFLLKRLRGIGTFFSGPLLNEYIVWYPNLIAKKQWCKDKLTVLK